MRIGTILPGTVPGARRRDVADRCAPIPTETGHRLDLRALAASMAAAASARGTRAWPGPRRMRGGQERKDEYVGIPEHVAPVTGARQSSGAYRRLPESATEAIRWNMASRIGELHVVVPRYDDVGVLPSSAQARR